MGLEKKNKTEQCKNTPKLLSSWRKTSKLNWKSEILSSRPHARIKSKISRFCLACYSFSPLKYDIARTTHQTAPPREQIESDEACKLGILIWSTSASNYRNLSFCCHLWFMAVCLCIVAVDWEQKQCQQQQKQRQETTSLQRKLAIMRWCLLFHRRPVPPFSRLKLTF